MKKERLSVQANFLGFGVLALLLGLGVRWGALALLGSAFNGDIPQGLETAVGGALYALGLLLARKMMLLVGMPKKHKLPLAQTQSTPMLNLRLTLMFGGVFAACNALSGLLQRFFPLQSAFAVQGGALEVVLALVFTCALPAFLEELVFRGTVQRMFLEWETWFAIAIGALMFALAGGELAQLPSLFLMGVYLGYAAQATGALALPAALHLVHNLLSFWLEYTALNRSANAVFGVSVWVFGLCLFAGLCGVLMKGAAPLPELESAVDGGGKTRRERLLAAPVFLLSVVLLLGRIVLGVM